jgi:hypothetical protein
MSSNAVTDVTLTLPETLTIRNILSIKEEIVSALENNSSVSLDIEQNAQVDLSFVQLVTSARCYADTHSKGLMLTQPAQGDFLDVLKRGGFIDDISPEAAKFWLHQETA